MNTRKDWFHALLAAACFSILGGTLYGSPVFRTFFTVAFVLVTRYLAGKLGITTSGIGATFAFAGRTFAITIAFFALRYLFGQAFHIYQVDALNDFMADGGYRGMLLGHQTPASLAYEILIFMLLWAIIAAWFKKGWVLKLIAVVGMGAIVLGIVFPGWGASLPEKRRRIDESLANKGIIKTVLPSSPASSDFAGYGPAPCDTDEPQDFSSEKTDRVDIELEAGCYHGPIKLPADWNTFDITHSHAPGDWVGVWCEDKPVAQRLHAPYESFGRDFNGCSAQGNPTTTFRAQGRGFIHFYVTTRKP